MDNNLHNDNLEQFFRKGLAEENHFPVDEMDWDMPSDAVWDGIADELPLPERVEEPKRRIMKYWWAAAAGILLLLFCFQTFNSQRKISNLQEQLALQAEQLKALQDGKVKKEYFASNKQTEEKFVLERPLSEKSNLLDREDVAVNLSQNDLAQNPAVKKNISLKTTSLLSGNGANNFFSKRASVLKNTNAAANFVLDGKEEKQRTIGIDNIEVLPSTNDKGTFVIKEIEAMASLDLDSKSQNFWRSEEPKVKDNLWMIEPICPAKKRRWYAGVFFAPSRFKTKTNKKTDVIAGAKGKVSDQSAYETGLRFGWQMDENWSLETGMAIAKSKKQITHDLSFIYNPDMETTNGEGDLESSYTADLRTDYGDVAVDLDLYRRPDQTFERGDRIDVSLENEIATAFLQIPLALRYGLQKGKFNLSMSAGILFSVLQKQQLDLPERRDMHPGFHKGSRQFRGHKPELNNGQVGVQTGVQLAYSPTTTVDFYLAPTYSHGLTPMVENEKGTTYLTQASVQGGVNVRF